MRLKRKKKKRRKRSRRECEEEGEEEEIREDRVGESQQCPGMPRDAQKSPVIVRLWRRSGATLVRQEDFLGREWGEELLSVYTVKLVFASLVYTHN